jgi:PIN domain nuclease of toxin-antitoxin system
LGNAEVIVLDTHIWVNWILRGEAALPNSIVAAMNASPRLAVSTVSCLEVSMLVKQRKLDLPLPFEEWLIEALTPSGVESLPITCEIARLSVALTGIHKDPADRMIIATAIFHDALLASVDSVFPNYPELAGRLVAR